MEGLTPPELWRLAPMFARTAMWAIRLNEDPQRILDHVDPRPEGTSG